MSPTPKDMRMDGERIDRRRVGVREGEGEGGGGGNEQMMEEMRGGGVRERKEKNLEGKRKNL